MEERLDQVFAGLPDTAGPARDAYATCLARRKAPAAPSDLLGSEFDGCRAALRQALLGAGLGHGVFDGLNAALEALEAELAADS